MKSRWKGAAAGLVITGILACLFVSFFYGINLDDGMVITRITRRGALWEGLHGNRRDAYIEPLSHFLIGAASMTAMLWAVAFSVIGPVGYLLGYLWEQRRKLRKSSCVVPSLCCRFGARTRRFYGALASLPSRSETSRAKRPEG